MGLKFSTRTMLLHVKVHSFNLTGSSFSWHCWKTQNEKKAGLVIIWQAYSLRWGWLQQHAVKLTFVVASSHCPFVLYLDGFRFFWLPMLLCLLWVNVAVVGSALSCNPQRRMKHTNHSPDETVTRPLGKSLSDQMLLFIICHDDMAKLCMCMKGLTSTAVLFFFGETALFWGIKCGEWITL